MRESEDVRRYGRREVSDKSSEHFEGAREIGERERSFRWVRAEFRPVGARYADARVERENRVLGFQLAKDENVVWDSSFSQRSERVGKN